MTDTASQFAAAAPSASVSRFHIAGYAPLDLISRDPLFELWRVRTLQTGEFCLWKQPRPEWSDSHAIDQLLAHEECSTLAISSPHLIRIHSPSEHPRPSFLIFENYDGVTLQSLMLKRARFSVESTLWIARQISSALADLRRAGFIHADLQPRSLLVHRSGQIKLTGLVIAQRLPALRSPEITDHALVLEDHESQPFRAPERLRSPAAPRLTWDMYSLGVLMYRLLSGRHPWPGESVDEIARQQLSSLPTPLRTFVPDLPAEIADFVLALFAREPLRRPDSWPQILDRLLHLEVEALRRAG